MVAISKVRRELTKMKTTKQLARELGLLRERRLSSASGERKLSSASGERKLSSASGERRLSSASGERSKQKKSRQEFPYLVVIDFESTCWERDKTKTQEIIEFPAVLLNAKTGQIENEFHYYVQPQEHPTLSAFCHKLTGISQEQVENGIPLSLCLRKFFHWLHTLSQEKNIRLVGDRGIDKGDNALNLAAIVTWSDWDLGVCLHYELRRKQIAKAPCFNQWIDLRATYTKFYGRKPKGLNGALQDVGIEFEGREHSGLHDSRNTAMLAWRMIRDGCVMSITKSLTPTSANVGSYPHTHARQVKKETLQIQSAAEKEGTKGQGNVVSSIGYTKPESGTNIKCGVDSLHETAVGLRMRNPNIPQSVSGENKADSCFEISQKRPALFTPQKNDVKCPRLSTAKRSAVKKSPYCTRNRSANGEPITKPSANQSLSKCVSKSISPSAVLSSGSTSNATTSPSVTNATAVSCSDFQNLGVTVGNLAPLSGDKCLAHSTAVVSDKNGVRTLAGSWVTPNTRQQGTRQSALMRTLLTPQQNGEGNKPAVTGSSVRTLYHPVSASIVDPCRKQIDVFQNTVINSRCASLFKTAETPPTGTQAVKAPQNCVASSTSAQSFRTSQNCVVSSTSAQSFRTPWNCVVSSTSAQSFRTPQNCVVSTSAQSFRTPQNSVIPSTRAQLIRTQNCVISSTSAQSLRTPQNSVKPSTNVQSFKTPQNPPVTFSTMRATPPLCKCGRRARRRMVQNPGPNMGRWFFSCVKGTGNTTSSKSTGCGFFQWEHAIIVPSGRPVTPVARQTYFSRAAGMDTARPFVPVLRAPVSSKGNRRLGVSSLSASSFR